MSSLASTKRNGVLRVKQHKTTPLTRAACCRILHDIGMQPSDLSANRYRRQFREFTKLLRTIPSCSAEAHISVKVTSPSHQSKGTNHCKLEPVNGCWSLIRPRNTSDPDRVVVYTTAIKHHSQEFGSEPHRFTHIARRQLPTVVDELGKCEPVRTTYDATSVDIFTDLLML